MSQQQIIKELHSIQFALKVQDAILNGYRVTRTFGKPDMQYKAILSKVGGLEGVQNINYQQNLDLKDVNQLHFALKLQQAILGGYRIKVDKRFGKFGVCWYASLEIGKGQLEELLKQEGEIKGLKNDSIKTDGVILDDAEQTVDSKPQTPKKRTTKQTANKEQ